jgi:fermentation-respiration switch protein FrsA (DUF1100 family)
MRRLAVLAAVPLLVAAGACSAGRAPAEHAAEPPVRDGGPAAIATPAPSASPPAGRSAPRDPYEVGERTLRMNRGGDRPLAVTIWYPAAGDGPAPARGRFPVVVFSHGLGGAPDDYRALLTRWAAAGFVVVAPAYPHTSRGADHRQVLDVLNQPADASHVLTRVLALDGAAGDPLRGHLDTSRVGAAGHSAGAITTLGMFSFQRDERLDAGVVLAGNGLGVGSGVEGPAAPLLFVHGRRDQVVSYASGKAAYDAVPWPKALLTLPDAGHLGGLGARDAEFNVVASATVEFLRWSLYGDPAAKRRLPVDARAGGVAMLDDRL